MILRTRYTCAFSVLIAIFSLACSSNKIEASKTKPQRPFEWASWAKAIASTSGDIYKPSDNPTVYLSNKGLWDKNGLVVSLEDRVDTTSLFAKPELYKYFKTAFKVDLKDLKEARRRHKEKPFVVDIFVEAGTQYGILQDILFPIQAVLMEVHTINPPRIALIVAGRNKLAVSGTAVDVPSTGLRRIEVMSYIGTWDKTPVLTVAGSNKGFNFWTVKQKAPVLEGCPQGGKSICLAHPNAKNLLDRYDWLRLYQYALDPKPIHTIGFEAEISIDRNMPIDILIKILDTIRSKRSATGKPGEPINDLNGLYNSKPICSETKCETLFPRSSLF